MRKLTAIGITCGVGSMLVGARQAGFDVLGNVEWRRYYSVPDAHGHTTFGTNFQGAILKEKYEDLDPREIERMMNPDLALGHPECGNFSQLAGANKNRLALLQDAADIPLFVDLVAKFRPTFFVMDDLPRSFDAFPMREYVLRLPDYDLFPEWVSNWGYGNVQKHRNRMFMIGALKEQRWAFVPGETEDAAGIRTLEEVIGDLPDPRVGANIPNHDPCALDETSGRSLSMRHIGDRPTWREVAEYAKDNWEPGKGVTYHANDGTIKRKPGSKIEYWGERGASVQCGASYKFHPVRFTPLTLRERARIQGFPDDFIFYGAKLNERGEYNYDRNVHMTKQTGKAMPVQFCRYASAQVAAHLTGTSFAPSGRRVLAPNPYVDREKMWYCENFGYADQQKACDACWLYGRCTIRMRKYRIGEPAAGQRDLIDPGVVPGPERVAEPATPATAATGGRPRRGKGAGPTAVMPEMPAQTDGATEGPAPSPKKPKSNRFVDLPREDEYDL